MATGTGKQRDISRGNDNQPKSGGRGSTIIETHYPRKHNQGGKVKVNSKRINPK